MKLSSKQSQQVALGYMQIQTVTFYKEESENIFLMHKKNGLHQYQPKSVTPKVMDTNFIWDLCVLTPYLHFSLWSLWWSILEEQFRTSLPQLCPHSPEPAWRASTPHIWSRMKCKHSDHTVCHHWNLTGDEILKPSIRVWIHALCGFCLTLGILYFNFQFLPTL